MFVRKTELIQSSHNNSAACKADRFISSCFTDACSNLFYSFNPPPPLRLVSLCSLSSSTVAVPVGVAVVSVFGLVFTASAFAWICCQRKNTKSQKTPPYKFVHMLKGVDIYPESLSGKKKFAAPATPTTADSGKTDVNGNCQTTPMSPSSADKLASSPNGSRPAMHLDLEKRDLNGNFATKPFHHHHQKVRSSPDLELPSPQAGFTQPDVTDRHDLPSPSSALSSQAPTPAVDREEKEGGLGTLHFSLEYQSERKAFIVHIKVLHEFMLALNLILLINIYKNKNPFDFFI